MMAKTQKATAVARVPAPQDTPIKGEILPPLAPKGLARREASNKFKFTKTAIDRLRAPDPAGKQRLYWDTELTGFGVLVSAVSDKKTYVVQRKLSGGKTRRVTVGPVNDDVVKLDDARTRAGAILAQFYQDKDPKAERREAARHRAGAITLQAALDSYIKNKRKKGGIELREKTKKDYRASIERHLKEWLKKPLRDITPSMVLERHKEIQASIDLGPKKNAERSVKFTGHSTANGVMTALRAVWNFHGKPGRYDLPTNPVGALDTSTMFEVKPRTRLVKDQDLPAFYASVNGLASRTARDYLLLLLFTGLRRREAAQLEWANLNLPACILHIPVTKTGKPLDLPMTDFVYDLLNARHDLGREGKYVFASHGKHGFIQEPKFFLNQVFKNTGIQVSPHDLRRGFITIAESTDVPFLALKALVNHAASGGGVTADYVVMNVERLREPAQRVADRIKLLCGISEPAKEKPKARRKKQKRANA
jgi:integrase